MSESCTDGVQEAAHVTHHCEFTRALPLLSTHVLNLTSLSSLVLTSCQIMKYEKTEIPYSLAVSLHHSLTASPAPCLCLTLTFLISSSFSTSSSSSSSPPSHWCNRSAFFFHSLPTSLILQIVFVNFSLPHVMAFLPLSLTLTPPPHQLPPSSPSPLAFTLVWGVNANGSARYTNKINTEQVLVKDYCSLSVCMFVVVYYTMCVCVIGCLSSVCLRSLLAKGWE